MAASQSVTGYQSLLTASLSFKSHQFQFLSASVAVAVVFDQERDHGEVFQELPFHYLEIAEVLMRQAKEDFSEDLYKVRPSCPTRDTATQLIVQPIFEISASVGMQVRDLVESIRKLRSTKIDAGLHDLRDAMTVKLNNLSAMECNVIRPFFQGALNRFYKLSKVRLLIAL